MDSAISRDLQLATTDDDAPLPTFTTLRLTRLGDYALEVALNRPRKSNAIDSAMWRELRACFEALAAQTGCVLCCSPTAAKFLRRH